jgi:transcription elongation factor GreA
VRIRDLHTEKEQRYTLVGQDEADLKDGKISVQSPVGRALIGKRVGDTLQVQTPTKVAEYEVLEIGFEDS